MRKGFMAFGAVMLTLILAGHSGEQPFSGQQLTSQTLTLMDSKAAVSSSIKIDADFGRMPLYFVANQGQMDKQVAYYVQGKDKTIYFTSEGMTLVLTRADKNGGELQFPDRSEMRFGVREEGREDKNLALKSSTESGSERWVVKLDFIGANPDVLPVGQEETGAIISYFNGKPEEWKTGLATYSKIIYRDLWPGIDLVYYGTVNKLKYEFIVRPGADPSEIRLAYWGADSISIDENGRLEVMTPAVSFSDDVPFAYQEINGEKVRVALTYKLNADDHISKERNLERRPASARGEGREAGAHVYGFEVGAYDAAQILVLDPAILAYCGYIGGSSFDEGRDIAVDGSGNAYVAGVTQSTETTFPEVWGPDLNYNGGTADAFVAKVNAAGTAVVYCGYIGGFGNDHGCGIAVDGLGNAYVTGYTDSWSETTFPVTVGPDLTYNGGDWDAFVVKVNSAGTSLIYCGYIGGADFDLGHGLAVDTAGNAYLTGDTTSTEATFPVTVGPDLTFNGGIRDAFVVKVNTTGTSLIYCGYIGGDDYDTGGDIAVDGKGNAYVTGMAESTQTTFPVTVGPDLTQNDGGVYGDAFVAKLNSFGIAFSYCGFIGGSGSEIGYGIAVDSLGNAYVTGETGSTEASFPVTVGPDLTYNGGSDAFVARVNTSGTAIDYCGYIGGPYHDSGSGIAVDASGNAHIAGTSYHFLYPYNYFDAYVAKINASGTELVHHEYIKIYNPDDPEDHGSGIAVDRFGNACVTGTTGSPQAIFPVTVGPDLTYNGGPTDAFVAKVYYFEQPVHKHAVGDFDGDGADEVAVDFGASGAWLWNGGTWSQFSTNNPENMIAFNIDGNADDELAADLGSLGLWIWNGGVWSQLSANDPEYLIAADTNNNGIDELIIDLGAGGLKWRQEDGYIFGMTGMDPQNIIRVDTDHDSGDEVVADFGTMGMWVCDAGNWSQLTSADPNTIAGADAQGYGNEGVATGLGGLGTWLWDSGAWSQLSGIYSDQLLSGKMVLGGGEEIAGDFGLLGVWLWGSGAWTQLSGVNADDIIAVDTDGNGIDEVAGDFAFLGLWLWNSGSWTQLSGVNPEGLLGGDIDGDSAMELIVDFKTLGVWLWKGGTWSQISALNPD